MTYRFRLEGALLVLQVGITKERNVYYNEDAYITWRDATVSDIPLANVFDTSPRGVSKLPPGHDEYPGP